jgi:hypothetical protein
MHLKHTLTLFSALLLVPLAALHAADFRACTNFGPIYGKTKR